MLDFFPGSDRSLRINRHSVSTRLLATWSQKFVFYLLSHFVSLTDQAFSGKMVPDSFIGWRVGA
jgi:hypothetical protein